MSMQCCLAGAQDEEEEGDEDKEDADAGGVAGPSQAQATRGGRDKKKGQALVGPRAMARVDRETFTAEALLTVPLDAPKVLMLKLVEQVAADTLLRSTPGELLPSSRRSQRLPPMVQIPTSILLSTDDPMPLKQIPASRSTVFCCRKNSRQPDNSGDHRRSISRPFCPAARRKGILHGFVAHSVMG